MAEEKDKNQKPESEKTPGELGKGEVPEDFIEQNSEEEINNDIPEVAPSAKKRNFLIIGVVAVLILFVVFSFIGGEDEKPIAVKDNFETISSSGVATKVDIPTVTDVGTDIPNLPALDKVIDEKPGLKAVSGSSGTKAPALPSLPGNNSATNNKNDSSGSQQTAQNDSGTENVPSIPPPISSDSVSGTLPPPIGAQNNSSQQEVGKVSNLTPEQLQARINTPMIVVGNSSGALDSILNPQNSSGGAGGTSVPKASSRFIGDTTSMIAQGKVIDAVLETAINTDLQGFIRAVVSRDVYAESGKEILIPKGSRLVGQYSAEIRRGQGRIFIVWERVIRPDGVDISLESPGVDPLGRQGLKGDMDNKYFEIFSNAFLFSTFNFAFATLAESATGSEGVSETSNPDGTRTTSGKASDRALTESVQNFGNTIKSVAGDLVSVKPTMTIDQGTRLKVFVNKDLFFDHDKPKEDDDRGIFR